MVIPRTRRRLERLFKLVDYSDYKIEDKDCEICKTKLEGMYRLIPKYDGKRMWYLCPSCRDDL